MKHLAEQLSYYTINHNSLPMKTLIKTALFSGAMLFAVQGMAGYSQERHYKGR